MGTWDVSRVTDMSKLFWLRRDFDDPGISAWDTSSVVNMDRLFACCHSLAADLGAWDTSSVTSMYAMFYRCTSFTGKGIGAWDVSRVADSVKINQCFVPG